MGNKKIIIIYTNLAAREAHVERVKSRCKFSDDNVAA